MTVHLFFLFLCFAILPFSHSSPETLVQVTYGTVLKLMHERTRCRLHSHEVPYGTGSGQQSVTGFPSVHDSNSYWVGVRGTPGLDKRTSSLILMRPIRLADKPADGGPLKFVESHIAVFLQIVRPQLNSSAKQGDAIKSKTIIRLQHMVTRRWLHSHSFKSPISGNLEVSCFGEDSKSDTGDHWKLEIEDSGKTWTQDQRVRLQHVDTGGYLHSHNKKYSRIAGGQQEVCGVRDKHPDNVWLAAEGVYLPVMGSQ